MHEIGALYQAVKTVEKIAAENNVQKIKYITLQVGELSGMLPMFFKEYFPVVTEDIPLFEDSELRIETVPGEGICNNCQTRYNIMEHEGACPQCGSRDKEILGGLDMLIKDIGVM